MASPQRSRRRARKDISIVLDTAKWKENIGFVEAAVALGHFISCEEGNCGRVIGVGISHTQAVQDVLDNRTGNWYEGVGQPRNDGWRCVEHSYTNTHGPVPTTPPAGA